MYNDIFSADIIKQFIFNSRNISEWIKINNLLSWHY